jgi:hypothetical protein
MNTIRRVVTGNNADGKSYIVADEHVKRGELWRCGGESPLGGMDRDPAGDAAAAPAILASTVAKIEPPAAGNNFFYVSIPPWSEVKSAFEQGLKPGFDAGGFHRTATIDYLFILDGEIELLLDEGGALLRAGDAAIQRNTRHAWRNHMNVPVNFLAVMIKV